MIVVVIVISSFVAAKTVTVRDDTVDYSFVQVTDLHIGDHLAADRLQNVVNTVNDLAKGKNIKWVFATGDITASYVIKCSIVFPLYSHKSDY
jgi:hypothetical protein